MCFLQTKLASSCIKKKDNRYEICRNPINHNHIQAEKQERAEAMLRLKLRNSHVNVHHVTKKHNVKKNYDENFLRKGQPQRKTKKTKLASETNEESKP